MSTNARPSDHGQQQPEIVVERLIAAPRELVFSAFKDPRHITQWWGPHGFSTTTTEMDVRPGGQWLFTMHGPDGTDYINRVRYTEVREPELLAYDHDGGDGADEVFKFKGHITFASEGGKTRVTLRLIIPTEEQRAMMAKFGAVEGGHQTLSRLDAYLLPLKKDEEKSMSATDSPTSDAPFVISRTLDAPRELVFKAFTEAERMKRWWGPKGFKVIASKMDLRPGCMYLYGMQAPDGSTMWGRFVYREVTPPERIVLVNSFSDEHGGITRHPMNPSWPAELLSTFMFEEAGPNQTKLTITWQPINAGPADRDVFDKGRSSMTQGWSGTFEQLEAYLAASRSGKATG